VAGGGSMLRRRVFSIGLLGGLFVLAAAVVVSIRCRTLVVLPAAPAFRSRNDCPAFVKAPESCQPQSALAQAAGDPTRAVESVAADGVPSANDADLGAVELRQEWLLPQGMTRVSVIGPPGPRRVTTYVDVNPPLQITVPTKGRATVTCFYASGARFREFETVNGLRSGTSQTWHESGRIRTEEMWADGLLEGWYREFSDSGQLLIEGSYRAGKQHRIWTTWHANGIRASNGEYRDGEKDGTWIVWDEAGHVNALVSGVFTHGVRQGGN